MNTILELLFTLTVAGSAVAACILLLRLISPDAFPTKWRYAIGKMAVGFYLLPIALVMQWLLPIFIPKQTVTVPPPGLSSGLQQTQSNLPQGFIPELNLSADAAFIFLSIWGTGALAFAIWQVYCYRRFIKNLQQACFPLPKNSEAAKQLPFVKEALGLKSNVQLAHSSAIRSPVLVGLWKPTIYFPMENIVNIDIGMVIHHELIHLKRKDLWVKAISLAASALHWFNPLVHILRRDIHTWSELSCDEEVVKEMTYTERKRYGETILSVMIGSKGMPVRFCASLSGDGKHLKRRLNMMLNVKKLKKKTLFLTITAVFLIAGISTSAAAWASNNTPKVVESEESHSESQAQEATPSPAPVAENKTSGDDAQPNEEAAPVPVPENKTSDNAQPNEEAAPVPVPENKTSDNVQPNEEAAPVPVVINETNDAETPPKEEALPAPVAENKTSDDAQSKLVAASPEKVSTNAESGAESQANQEPAPPVDDGYRKSHPNEIPPGTSITVRPMTPEEKAAMRELEEEFRATLTPEELAEYDFDE